MSVVCCVLSGRGLCDGLITRPEDPTDCDASLFVMKKHRGGGCHSRSALGCGASETKR
jgi:hypothetical protein